MDNLRASDPYGSGINQDSAEHGEYVSYDENEDAAMDPPPSIQGDERRMQVRAYNFWTEQLNDNNYPSVEDLNPEDNEDFAPYGVLLDFTSGMENPSITYVGEALRKECRLAEDVTYLDQVPARSLLSRITDHYLQIIANKSPIGFEAEFTNESNVNIMYRGILLPYSSDDDTIDFIYGVINWKEGADKNLVAELETEVGNALLLDTVPDTISPQLDTNQIWADGPTAGLINNDDADAHNASSDITATPAHFNYGSEEDILELSNETVPTENDSLADWLHAARSSADNAKNADARSRETLYKAIGQAYDFSLIADKNFDDYKMILEDSGLKVQDRAPMTPIVKLIFGHNYDKTRVTEIASALNHAWRKEIPMGGAAEMISSFDGGLKGVVKAERLARKIDKGETEIVESVDPRDQLRDAPARNINEFAGEGDEFIIMVARRNQDGSIDLIGSVDADAGFTEKALRNTKI